MPVKQNIHFFFQKPVVLRERARLRLFINKIFKKEGLALKNLNYVFVSDRELLEINKQYLGHDFFTDIITFNLSTDPLQIEGEIYISVDRVRENAKNLKASMKQELLRVIFHGALHLCSYNDKTSVQKKEMRRKEDELILLYSKTSRETGQ